MTKLQEDSPLAFVAIQAALKAGNLLKRGFGTHFVVSTKTDEKDLVTEFDRTAERTIIECIKEQFPSHNFIGEESGFNKSDDNSVCWIIDPLDGTMNFAHQIPLFAVSIAAVVKDKIEVAVVYDPMTNELFVAQRGSGAFLNGTRLKVSSTADLKNAVVATGFPYSITATKKETLNLFTHFVDIGIPIRILGSSVLSLAYVAAGRFDAYYGSNLNMWDTAAGQLLVEEAGGKTTPIDYTTQNFLQKSNIAATNAHLHPKIISLLK